MPLLMIGRHWGKTAGFFVAIAVCLVFCVAAQEESASPTPDPNARVWIEPGDDGPLTDPYVRIRYREEHRAADSIVFEGEVHSEEKRGPKNLTFSIVNAGDEVVHEGRLELDVPEGIAPFRFEWTPSALADGDYTAEIVLWRNRIVEDHFQTLGVRKLSRGTIDGEVATAEKRVAELERHMDERGPWIQSAHYRMTYALIQDSLETLRRENLQPRRRYDTARYILDAADSVASRVALGGEGAIVESQAIMPELAHLKFENGLVHKDGEPVFLFGYRSRVPDAKVVEDAARYELNWSVFEVTPADVYPTEATERRAPANDVFAAARDHNVAVSYLFDMNRMPDWVYEARPAIREGVHGSFDYEVQHPAIRALHQRFYGGVVPPLARNPMLNGFVVLDRPAFHLAGPAVRREFMTYVLHYYDDRYSLNRAWNTRLATLDEIDIWRPIDATAYQYDWQTFHQRLVREYIESITETIRRDAPEEPLTVAYADSLFLPGDARRGIDPQELQPLLDATGASAALRPQHSRYAMDYPHQSMMYTYLKSVAPEQPLFNFEDFATFDPRRYRDYTYGFVYAALWDGVMSGLNGSAAWSPDSAERPDTVGRTPFQRPQCVEAFAAACIDINRLADIVADFQRAPAPVAVLWSEPAKIYREGNLYLPSALTAYEGVSLANQKVRFITESQMAQGGLDEVRVLVIPAILTLSEPAFDAVERYIEDGGSVIRTAAPIPYDEWGRSRDSTITTSYQTLFLPTEPNATQFLDAMDAVIAKGALPDAPLAQNAHEYPMEGVKTRYIRRRGAGYLYIVNLRQEPAYTYMSGDEQSGWDLISGRQVQFPTLLNPLDPMLIRLDPPAPDRGEEPRMQFVESDERIAGDIPTAQVTPVEAPAKKR